MFLVLYSGKCAIYLWSSSVEKTGLYVKVTSNLELICYIFIVLTYFYSSIPSSGDLWNVYVNIETRRLDLWESLVPVFTYIPNTPFFEMTVPTRETVRIGFIMERLLAIKHPVLLTGLTGKNSSLSVPTEYCFQIFSSIDSKVLCTRQAVHTSQPEIFATTMPHNI